MVIKISSYYSRKGFHRAYLATNKEPRRVCTLRTKDGRMTSMSYAKYLYTSYYECDIPDGEQIDHINGDRMDDRIENLQKISRRYNNIKDKPSKNMIIRKCPVCNDEFIYEKRNLAFRPNPCCSRKCAGIKSHKK